MAGLFMCLGFPWGLLGLLGFDFGVNLVFLCFHLSSICDSILNPLVSILEFLPAPAAARSFSAPLTRRSFRHKRLNSDDCTLYAGSGKSPLSSGCFAIRRGLCRCSVYPS